LRLDNLKWNDHTHKHLSKKVKLIYYFLEAHCSTAGFISLVDYDFILVKGTHKKRAQNNQK